MNYKSGSTVIQLLAFGLLLVIIKVAYLFFDYYNILDFVVFLAAGIILGGKVPSNRRLLGLLLALPAFSFCLFFVIRLGYSSIMQGIGTSFAVSLIIIPAAVSIGIFVNKIYALRRGEQKK